jgi:NADPH:quinone reductase-like Zn-dependent oxidoreductase
MLRARSIAEKAQVMAALAAFTEERTFRVPVEETFPLERTQDAYERFKAGNKFGKIVVCP